MPLHTTYYLLPAQNNPHPMKFLNLYLLVCLFACLTTGCAAMKRKKGESAKATETAGIFTTSKTDIDLLHTTTDTVLLVAGDSLTADFLTDTGTLFKQVESGTMVLQVKRDSAGKIYVRAITKARTVAVKRTTTRLKTRSIDSAAKTEARTKEATRITDTERKALIPEWAWAAGFGVVVLVIAFFLYRFLKSAIKE